MSTSRQGTLIIILSGVLVAALLAAGAVVFLLPPDDGSPRSSNTAASSDSFFSRLSTFSSSIISPKGSAVPELSDFDVTPLDRNAYTELNTSLIDNGLLPVRPDPAPGKANPFL